MKAFYSLQNVIKSFILAILGEKAAEEVATATCHMHQWALFAKAQARGYDEHEGDSLD